MCSLQGRSHDSLSGQVEFVPSLSDLHFRTGATEIFSYGYFEQHLKLEGLMACLHRKFGLCTNEFGSIFYDIKD